MPAYKKLDQGAAPIRVRHTAGPRAPGGQSSPPPDALMRTGEYSILGLPRSATQTVVRGRQQRFAFVVFAVATGIAALYGIERFFYSRLINDPIAFGPVIASGLLFTYGWAVLTPAVMWAARRFPVWGSGRRRASNWAIQLVALGGFVVSHVGIFAIATRVFDPVAASMPLARLFGQYMLSWSILDAIVFCSLVSIHHAVIYYSVSKDRALRASQLEARLAQAQLQMLRMQLQPHFLFNTLHSISALMHKDVRRADSMIASLSDLLRMSLNNIGAQEVPLQSELDFLQRYVDIMSLRFGDRLKVTIDVAEETRDARVPTLFLQPLVENAFRHGFGDSLAGGTVSVRARRAGDMLWCEITDDGKGLKAGHREGVGLSTTRQRLAHLYGERHSFVLRGAPGEGVHVTMSIPFTSYERTAAD